MSGFTICWTNNCRGASDYGLYVMHAARDEGTNKTLCAVRVQEFGRPIDNENQPSCKKCIKTMERLTK